MKIVCIFKKSKHSAEIISSLNKLNIPIHTIFIERGTQQSILKKTKNILIKYGFFVLSRFIINKISSIFRKSEYWQQQSFYQKYTDNIIDITNANDGSTEQKLLKIQPDLIVLSNPRILNSNIIDIPKIGILNAHPGLLPKYRGVDVIPWAILNGDNVGVTIHFINKGIDSGKIAMQKSIQIMGDDDLESIKSRADTLAGKLMAKTVLSYIRGEKLKLKENSNGKLYGRMNIKTLYQVKKILKKNT